MAKSSRLPVVAFSLIAGGIVGLMFSDQLRGQAVIIPPPVVQPKELTSYRDVVKQVLPAVVSIEARGGKKSKEENLGTGSGVLIDPSGVVLTAYHVVEGAESAEVTLQDGRRFISSVIRHDPKTDLAVVKLNSVDPLPFLEFADSDTLEVGDRVLAVGAPFGLSGSVTHGIISAKGRTNLKLNTYEDFIQTDAAINPGNSGGPLIGLDGKIVGINSAIKTRSGGFQGVGLAISSNLAKDVGKQLLTKGSVARGYLGISIRDVEPAIARRLRIDGGVTVTKVYDGTPAAKVKLRDGDVILSLGGFTVKDAAVLPKIVAKLPLNQQAELKYIRGTQRFSQQITIEEQPAEYGLEKSTSNKMVPTKPEATFSSEVGYGLSVTEGRGLTITGVAPNSLAAASGLARGTVILSVDNVAVSTAEALRKALVTASKEKGALLKVQRMTGEVDYAVLKLEK
ncbi:DegQ family serine endoprotease [soil metagenome]